MSPMPFWPSFEPCAKLTPVQVSINSSRIGHGGGSSPTGGSNSALLRTRAFINNRTSAAMTKPIRGDSSSALPTSATLVQLTPSPSAAPGVR